MSDLLRYAALASADIDHLRDLDRSEEIDGIYEMRDGDLVSRDLPHRSPSWTVAMQDTYIRRVQQHIDNGGVAFGAWDQDRLVGIAVLDPLPVGGDPAVCSLDLLHVSDGYRGRGIGHRLVEAIGVAARERGASALYISATPTRNTVDAYRRMGAVPLVDPDPVMLAREPDDIHLRLSICRLLTRACSRGSIG